VRDPERGEFGGDEGAEWRPGLLGALSGAVLPKGGCVERCLRASAFPSDLVLLEGEPPARERMRDTGAVVFTLREDVKGLCGHACAADELNRRPAALPPALVLCRGVRNRDSAEFPLPAKDAKDDMLAVKLASDALFSRRASVLLRRRASVLD